LVGSWDSIDVSDGYFSIGGEMTSRSGQRIAPRGFYAEKGMKYACPAGRFGFYFYFVSNFKVFCKSY